MNADANQELMPQLTQAEISDRLSNPPGDLEGKLALLTQIAAHFAPKASGENQARK